MDFPARHLARRIIKALLTLSGPAKNPRVKISGNPWAISGLGPRRSRAVEHLYTPRSPAPTDSLRGILRASTLFGVSRTCLVATASLNPQGATSTNGQHEQMVDVSSDAGDDYKGLLGGSTQGYFDALVPASPHSPKSARRTLGDDNDLIAENLAISDHFEMEDGDECYDEDDGESDEPIGGMHAGSRGTATPAQVAVNIFISFVGAGLLGLPYAYSRSGWLLGSVALGLVSTGNVYAMLLLVKCRKKLEARGLTGINGYGDLGREVLGPRGEVLVNVCLVVSQTGFATAYLIFISANIQSITDGNATRAAIIFGCVPVLSLLVQYREMKKLSPFSLVADVANLMGLSCVIFQDFEYNTHSDNIKAVDYFWSCLRHERMYLFSRRGGVDTAARELLRQPRGISQTPETGYHRNYSAHGIFWDLWLRRLRRRYSQSDITEFEGRVSRFRAACSLPGNLPDVPHHDVSSF
ncbi:hypothetical protein THAOC_21293 [Thalassiosira oceanica]|uniref:Amino acid transporter transmembrane domain-containing protein n=1 Tax=Thalassiosira oceanica TaxID=159749 RepID=K0RXN2_THAOC|nr:hypothetical protein THAOC_21293 [Thalassiosira oceanica]|eukprot:EJK58568.1 hypothetical protein THAOC_21293 [Thalassiosira oceanica]